MHVAQANCFCNGKKRVKHCALISKELTVCTGGAGIKLAQNVRKRSFQRQVVETRRRLQ